MTDYYTAPRKGEAFNTITQEWEADMEDYYKKDTIEISEPCNTCIAKYWSMLCNRCKNCLYYTIKERDEIDLSKLKPPQGPVPL